MPFFKIEDPYGNWPAIEEFSCRTHSPYTAFDSWVDVFILTANLQTTFTSGRAEICGDTVQLWDRVRIGFSKTSQSPPPPQTHESAFTYGLIDPGTP